MWDTITVSTPYDNTGHLPAVLGSAQGARCHRRTPDTQALNFNPRLTPIIEYLFSIYPS